MPAGRIRLVVACLLAIIGLAVFVPDGRAAGVLYAGEWRWENRAANCDFNRIAMSEGGNSVLLWNDRRPLFRAYGSFWPTSQIAWIARGAAPRFANLAGEVSALHWLANGQEAEFLLDGHEYMQVEPDKGRVVRRSVPNAWRAIGIKNLRWGGLGLVLADRDLLDSMPTTTGDINRQRGYVLAGANNNYYPLAAANAPVLPDILDMHSAESLYDREDYGTASAGIWPKDPAFDPSTGQIAGWFGPRGTYASKAGTTLQTDPVPGSLLRAYTVLGDMSAELSAFPDGSHWLRLGMAGDARLLRICGPATATPPLAKTLEIGDENGSYPAIHSGRGGKQHLFVRFHGGPYSSVFDDFPSIAVQRITALEGDVLEVSSPGSRLSGKADLPRVTPETLRAFSRSVAAWIGAKGYEEVTVLGESFGAVGALDFALHDPSRIRQLVLMAPLTTLDPQKTLTGRRLDPRMFQARAEEAILGTHDQRQAFAQWLNAGMQQACSRLKVMIVVGENDERTPPNRQAACARDQMKVIPLADHSSLFTTDDAWAWLADHQAMLTESVHFSVPNEV